MSIKIYSGRKVTGLHHSLRDVVRWSVKVARPRLEAAREEELRSIAPTREERVQLWRDWSRATRAERSQHSAVLVDFGAELVWFAFRPNVQLVLPIFQRPCLLEAFDAIPGVSHHGYWNNTDPPDGVSEDEWQTRKLEWGALTDRNSNGIPCDNGLSIRLLEPGVPLPLPKGGRP